MNFNYKGQVSAYQSGFNYSVVGQHLKPGLTSHYLAIRAYQAAGAKPSAKDVTQRESEIRVARIRQPRLQNDEAWDMEMLRQTEDVRLNNYILLDKNSGKVSIPVEQAMRLFLQRQPPAAAQQGAATNQEMGENSELPMPASGTGTTRPSIESSHAKASGGKD